MASPRNVKSSKRPVLCEKCGEGYKRKKKSDIFCPSCKQTQQDYSIEKTCTRCNGKYRAWSKFSTGANYCKECAEVMKRVNLSIVMDKAKTIHNAPKLVGGNRWKKSVIFVTNH